jgi:DNA invertase Pin-like site-specific DNA recombinase
MPSGPHTAYYRVSTAQQGRSGLGLEAQRAAVMAYLNGGAWTLAGEFTEVESGKGTANRPELAKALQLAKLTGGTLVIAKLDRLSRDAWFLLGLQRAGVPFVAVDMPQANALTVGIMALVAQQEREAISARTKAALQAAKVRGAKLGGWRGGPVGDLTAAREASAQQADQFAGEVVHLIVDAQRRGLSLRGVAAELTAKGIRTARGGSVWTADGVRRVICRTTAV